MSLLPISQEDLELCAQRWGWLCATRPDGSGYARKEFTHWWFDLLCEDSYNAAAILDRENWLIRKGIYGNVTLYGNHHVFTWNGTMSGINIPDSYIAAPNFRSWLLVQLTLQLPPEVWK